MKKCLIIFSLFAFAGFSNSLFAKKIVVGGKFFTEQYILSEITKQILESNGFDVTSKVGLGSNLVRKAHEQKEVDIYWEYTGTSLVAYNKVKDKLNRRQTYERVKKLDAKKGIIWLKPAQANNTFALAMRSNHAQDLGIRSIEDYTKKYQQHNLKFAVTAEFLGRPDGLKGLQKAYDARISRKYIKSMDSGLIYQAIKDSQVDVGIVFATDGRIAAFGFEVLKDNKGFFPDYSLAAVVRKEVLDQYPEIESLMNDVADQLNDKILQQLNASVDIDKNSVEDVARKFIDANL